MCIRDRDKHIRNRAGQRSEKQAAKISQSERALERLEVVEEPRKEWELRMEIAAAPRSGAVVAVLSISGPVERLSPSPAEKWGAQLGEAAAALSSAL